LKFKMKKILVITPKFPIPTTGACEQDRLEGILQLQRLGFDVRVISKITAFQDKIKIEDFGRKNNIQIHLISYKNKKNFKRFLNPLYWDGAAYEYTDEDIQHAVKKIIKEWNPDLAWFDYTYLWPLYKLFRKNKIPIVTRSINFEPIHFLQEDGYTPVNIIKFLVKLITEMITIWKSSLVYSITPKEKRIYEILTYKKVLNLPLRGLPKLVGEWGNTFSNTPLDVFFFGSTYNVSHNKRALKFLLKEVFPNLSKDKFIFHILGAKFPEEFKKYLTENVIYHGFVADLNNFLKTMDVAIVPSIYGAGMQQKIFEPLVRGIPTIASFRGLAGYSYMEGKDLLVARNKESFIKALNLMEDFNLRKKLSGNSLQKSREMFNQKKIDNIVLEMTKTK